MCDYSLHLVKTRPAQVGDKLVTTTFENSTTRGFAALGEPDVAVCLRPGTELVFAGKVEYDNFLGVLPKRRVDWNMARFRQIQLDEVHAHHDALEFPDGHVVLLTRLCEGQHVTVLQLPADPTTEDKAHEHAPDTAVV